jgi:hypothetical protein
MSEETRERRPGSLTSKEAQIVRAIAARIVRLPVEDAPTLAQTDAMETMDRFVATLPGHLRTQLGLAIKLINYGAPLFSLRPRTFLGMSGEQQDSYLRGWAHSRIATRRIAFRAVRNLAMLGYYSHEATWPMVGYEPPSPAEADS